MERLDKLIASRTDYSRKEVQKLVRSGAVLLNGHVASSADLKVDPLNDQVLVQGRPVQMAPYLYIMLNKPRGVVSASNDSSAATVVDLVPETLKRPGLFPAGRLDKDTEGFVLITNDGQFAHRILSPRNHIPKTYLVEVDGAIPQQVVEDFAAGMAFMSGERCMPASLQVGPAENQGKVILREGMYHQIKRMFLKHRLTVTRLKRVKMGGLELDPELKPGECREITSKELEKLLYKIDE